MAERHVHRKGCTWFPCPNTQCPGSVYCTTCKQCPACGFAAAHPTDETGAD